MIFFFFSLIDCRFEAARQSCQCSQNVVQISTIFGFGKPRVTFLFVIYSFLVLISKNMTETVGFPPLPHYI